MSDPKPADEAAPVQAEIRGGDRPTDWEPTLQMVEGPIVGIGESQASYALGGEDDEDSAGE